MKKEYAIIAVLVIIIIALTCYVVFTSNTSRSNVTHLTNKGLLVLDEAVYSEYEGDDGEAFILKVKNTSGKTYNNVTPVLIYYDSNNMPIHEAWGARISYFSPEDTRCIRFYDVIKDYDKVEIGLFDRDDEEENPYIDLRDQISYEAKKDEEPDEEGYQKIVIKGENKSDKNVLVEFQIAYYTEDDDLFYEDQFMDLVDANSSFETYSYYETEFYDGTKFPAGYKYEVTLIEAVNDLDEEEDDEPVVLTNEDEIESAVYKLLKKNYGKDLDSAKIYVEKTYTAEQAEKYDAIKDLNLGENDVAFEVTIYLQPVKGADIMPFTIPDGEYDEDTGWVSGIGRLGVLRQKQNGEYEITDYGTGW